MKRIDTSKVTFWAVSFLLLIFVEACFFHNGNIVFVLLGAGLLYYGSRRRSKWMFVLGLFFIVMALTHIVEFTTSHFRNALVCSYKVVEGCTFRGNHAPT